MRTQQAAKPLDFQRHGAEHHRGAIASQLSELRTTLAHVPNDRAGVRITGLESLRPLIAATGAIGSIAAAVLGPDAKAVRAIHFDKTVDTNWALAWHQDRTICVRRRVVFAGFGPWTVKQGLLHVAPPFDLLTRMVTLRVHLDDVPQDNAPLRIAPGSHTFGRVATGSIAEIVGLCGEQICLAEAGDVWLYATPILHASDEASAPVRRRVLQIDYAAEHLPGGLEWFGV